MMPSVGETVEKSALWFLAGGNAKGCSHTGKQVGSFFYIIRNSPGDPSTPTVVLSENENVCSHKNLYLNIYRILFMTAPNWEQPRHILIGNWIQLWYIFTVRHCTSITMNKLQGCTQYRQISVALMLSKRSQIQKDILYNSICVEF